ncbi:uncharacterized protein LOC112450172 isoform X2 [Kryptolebias marmoratus]|uniref:uncharacterized protein LOC112450172 isoform X2 n=1 Tax=Kryptolebias marmoratus TaxID=37003 RepID=UPI000D53055E|nr:uncharacterized protein LOC112450172 isoform X2 [Kryptolebias marmoratus]
MRKLRDVTARQTMLQRWSGPSHGLKYPASLIMLILCRCEGTNESTNRSRRTLPPGKIICPIWNQSGLHPETHPLAEYSPVHQCLSASVLLPPGITEPTCHSLKLPSNLHWRILTSFPLTCNSLESSPDYSPRLLFRVLDSTCTVQVPVQDFCGPVSDSAVRRCLHDMQTQLSI